VKFFGVTNLKAFHFTFRFTDELSSFNHYSGVLNECPENKVSDPRGLRRGWDGGTGNVDRIFFLKGTGLLARSAGIVSGNGHQGIFHKGCLRLRFIHNVFLLLEIIPLAFAGDFLGCSH